MVDNFICWLNHNKKEFQKHGFFLFDTLFNEQEESSKGSVVVTTENDDYICQFTIRNNGLTDIEIIDVKGGDLVFYIYCKSNMTLNFDNMFAMFFDFCQ